MKILAAIKFTNEQFFGRFCPSVGRQKPYFSCSVSLSSTTLTLTCSFSSTLSYQLVALRDGDHWVQGVDEIKKFVKHFFVNNFTEEWSNRPHLDGISFPILSLDDNLFLMGPFSVDEVHDVVWNSDGNKCPDPDGFNFNFLKACWDTVKGDIMDFVHDFHSNAILPKAITTSFLALIPKNIILRHCMIIGLSV
ncbi:unnamed protein product [Trifolium pratense]|uniref:Uncharacterized protein n=1 Tax=Trifolium pratense TaxID=57577 RepID=A0ACB0IVF2_TRIPR|nr:unnamed protein product [Trifolium pratense]